MATDEVKTFCANVHSARTNMRNGNISHYTMTYKKNKHQRSVLIPISAISNNGIFTNKLGTINGFSDCIGNIDEVVCECRLLLDKRYNRFYLYVPQYREIIKDENVRNKVVALDPGVVLPNAFYSLDIYGKIGENVGKQMLIYEAKIRKYQRILSKRENKTGDKLNNSNKIKKKIRKLYSKIKNLQKNYIIRQRYFCVGILNNISNPRI